MFQRRPGSTHVAHPLGIELPGRRRRAGQAPALRPVALRPAPERIDPAQLRQVPSEAAEPASGSLQERLEAKRLAEKRLAKVMKQLALQEVELARLRAAADATSLDAPLAHVGEGASAGRAERNRATMRALFEANVQLRRDLAAQTLNS